MRHLVAFIGSLILILAAYAGVSLFVEWSKSRLLDVPNERSSHTVPTPRGGGAVIVILSIPAFLLFPAPAAAALALAAAIIAAVSLADDVRGVPALYRFACHGAAAIVLVGHFGAPAVFAAPFAGEFAVPALAAAAVWSFWIVGMINAYNFMDGIDGIAGGQALCAGSSWAVAGLLTGDDPTFALGAVTASLALGFLLHNWSPARVFLGDIGSAFWGFLFAAVPLQLAARRPELSGIALGLGAIFVWPFVFDSAFTILRRLWRRQKVWQPHREHVYQLIVIAGRSHSFVSALYAALSILASATVLAAFGLGCDASAAAAAAAALSAAVLAVFFFFAKRRTAPAS